MRKCVLPEQRREAQSRVYRLGGECRRGIALESKDTDRNITTRKIDAEATKCTGF